MLTSQFPKIPCDYNCECESEIATRTADELLDTDPECNSVADGLDWAKKKNTASHAHFTLGGQTRIEELMISACKVGSALKL